MTVGAWSHCTELVGYQYKNQNDADDDIRLASCELMSNLCLTNAIQERAAQGRLTSEINLLNALLKFVRGKRPLKALLGFFANVHLNFLPPNFITNVFNAMVSSDDEDVWHRALYIISEYIG